MYYIIQKTEILLPQLQHSPRRIHYYVVEQGLLNNGSPSSIIAKHDLQQAWVFNATFDSVANAVEYLMRTTCAQAKQVEPGDMLSAVLSETFQKNVAPEDQQRLVTLCQQELHLPQGEAPREYALSTFCEENGIVYSKDKLYQYTHESMLEEERTLSASISFGDEYGINYSSSLLNCIVESEGCRFGLTSFFDPLNECVDELKCGFNTVFADVNEDALLYFGDNGVLTLLQNAFQQAVDEGAVVQSSQ